MFSAHAFRVNVSKCECNNNNMPRQLVMRTVSYWIHFTGLTTLKTSLNFLTFLRQTRHRCVC